MKAVIVIAVALMVAALGWWLASPENGSHRSDETSPSHSPPPTATNTNPTEVFEKAFWRHPTANDKILHAERREWADAEGVQKWQWFIAVQPSPELLKHLRDDNAFNLVASATEPRIGSAPSWFATKGQVLQSSQGNMRLFFNEMTGVLHATDCGAGFRPGAPEPAKPSPSTVAVPGRLPTTPPPKPQTSSTPPTTTTLNPDYAIE